MAMQTVAWSITGTVQSRLDPQAAMARIESALTGTGMAVTRPTPLTLEAKKGSRLRLALWGRQPEASLPIKLTAEATLHQGGSLIKAVVASDAVRYANTHLEINKDRWQSAIANALQALIASVEGTLVAKA